MLLWNIDNYYKRPVFSVYICNVYNAQNTRCIGAQAGETREKNLRKFSGKFLHLCVDKQYSINAMSTRNHRLLHGNLRKFIADVCHPF